MRAERLRLDELLVARGLARSRSVARALVMAGEVLVGDRVCDKAGTAVAADVEVSLKRRPRFVSRGGEKLAHALEAFRIEVRGASALDIGASTGGFVDCLLQAGAARVIAVDVGRGQLDEHLRVDQRVHVLDRVNARHLVPAQLPYQPGLLTMDVSFISVEKVFPAAVGCMANVFEGVILIKPQFEAGRHLVGKGGIVRDPEVHRLVLRERGRFVVDELGVELMGMCQSGLPGTDGNLEFFFHVARAGEKGLGLDRLESLVNDVVDGTEPAGTGRDR